MNHIYEAIYSEQYGYQVLVNGRPLSPCLNIANHSPTGFSWGYGGSGPAQLALAIMVNEYGSDLTKHPINYQDLKTTLIAVMPQEIGFTTTSEIIRDVVSTIKNKQLNHQGNGF